MSRVIRGNSTTLLGSAVPAVILSTMFLWLGCGGAADGPERIQLSGKVTFGGDAVPEGEITFIPNTSKGGSGPAGSASIVNGSYRTNADQGPVEGPQVVRITGFSGEENSDPAEGKKVLFRDYQTTIEVSSGQSTIDFDVPQDAANGNVPNPEN